jgi:hypothetical protein
MHTNFYYFLYYEIFRMLLVRCNFKIAKVPMISTTSFKQVYLLLHFVTLNFILFSTSLSWKKIETKSNEN